MAYRGFYFNILQNRRCNADFLQRVCTYWLVFCSIQTYGRSFLYTNHNNISNLSSNVKVPHQKQKISKENYATNKAEENQSYDLASIYSRYYDSAISFKNKYSILPEMEAARFIISEHRTTVERDGKGNLIKDFFKKEQEA